MPPRPVSLRLSRSLNSAARDQVISVLQGLPELTGRPIGVCALPRLTAYRGLLLSGSSTGRGIPVHAASFIPKREIVLETALLRRPRALRLIMVHEIFHFVWASLGNPRRREFTALLQIEVTGRARGELGDSSLLQKDLLPGSWRDYVCESFCDTAGWLYAGVSSSQAFTLAARWRKRRQEWFELTFGQRRSC
jgi:hypothetical protein